MTVGKWLALLVGVVVVAGLGFLAWFRLETNAQARVTERRPKTPLSVRAASAERGSIQSWVFAEGTARSVRREYLTFQNAGRVVFVKDGADGEDLREGTAVMAGEVVARQDARDLEADVQSAEAIVAEAVAQVALAEAEVRRARTDRELAAKTLDRLSQLLDQDSASRREYDEAKAAADREDAVVAQTESRVAAAQANVASTEARLRQAKLSVEETELRAPIDGIVAYVNVKEGYYFTPSLVRTDDESTALQTVPMVIIDPTAYEVTVNIPSYARMQIRAGSSAIVAVGSGVAARFDSRGGAADERGVIRGTVFSVNPAVSPGGRAVQVKVRVSEGVDALEDGLFVSVWLAAERRDGVVVVPVDAVIYENNVPHVFVVTDGTATRRSVTLGLQEFTTQEVTSGIEAGERVVTDGRFRVSEGALVRVLDEARAGAEERP